jgi:hypothetical protein
MNRLAVGGLALAALVAAARPARANPEPLPFSYVAATLPKDQLEVEMYTDLVATHADENGTGKEVSYLASQFQIELEYGLSRRFELGLYLTFAPPLFEYQNTPIMPEGNGAKERIKFHATDALAPIDLSFYFELVENQREIELEGKLIGERRFGPVRAIANLWAEREQYYVGRGETVLNPTAGVVFEATPIFQPGIESWMHVEFPDQLAGKRPFALGPHLYVGPTVLLSFAKLWWSTGAYFRVTDVSRPTEVGDTFGKLWFRTVFGLPL